MAKKQMLAFAPRRSAELEARLHDWGFAVAKKKMFGHETFFHNGHMFAGANVEGIFVHVGRETAAEALAGRSEAAPFRPREDMVMRDYILLKEEALADESLLREWLEKSYAYLSGLPPKTAKNKARG
jgi:TfoX/Sxy family transcriptional regulator of competence genes